MLIFLQLPVALFDCRDGSHIKCKGDAVLGREVRLNLRDQVCLFDVGELDVYCLAGYVFLVLALLPESREIERHQAVGEAGEAALPLPVVVDRSKCPKRVQPALEANEGLRRLESATK